MRLFLIKKRSDFQCHTSFILVDVLKSRDCIEILWNWEKSKLVSGQCTDTHCLQLVNRHFSKTLQMVMLFI